MRHVEAEELSLLGFELLLLGDLANAVVRKLLKPPRTLFRGQIEALGDIVELLRDLAQDFFAPADGVLEDADAPQAALVDLGIHGARRDEVDDGDRLALLSVAVNAADALLDAHGIPGQIVVDEEIAELEVETLAADFGGQQDIQRIGMRLWAAQNGCAARRVLRRAPSPWIRP